MRLLTRTRLGRRFLFVFVTLLLLCCFVGLLFSHIATDALRQQSYVLLRVASNGAEAQVLEFLASLKRATQSRAFEPEVRSLLKSGSKSFIDLSATLANLQIRMPEVQEVFYLDLQGTVVASSSAQILGTNRRNTPEFQQGRQTAFAGDITREPDTGAIRWRMSAPLRDSESPELLGVVVVGFDPAALTALTAGKRVLAQGANTQSFRIGETGETYIVNREGALITESRFASNTILSHRIETTPVRAALREGREILSNYKDYRGVDTVGASAIIEEMRWVMVTEIDFDQVTEPIKTLRDELLVVAVLVGGIGLLVARGFNRQIIHPLQLASDADRALGRGEEAAAFVPEDGLRNDEIGDFIRQRNANVSRLLARERELIEEQKRRAEAAAALEAISYSMVHDMRAPLRAICTFGDLLCRETVDRLNATEKDYVARMKSACLRMDQLICDMLRYSSMLNAEVPLSSVNISELVRRVITTEPVFDARKADINIDCNAPPVLGNAPLLCHCFSVLLDNAFRYAKPDIAPQVNIREETTDGWARVFVEDNGIGISKKFQARLFGIFQKGTLESQGTGIGLALVRVAVERMGGRVGAFSEEGKGSRFWIELKLAG